VIELTRNFGQHKANMTGLEMASGDLVFLIEADLEESPEWVVDFYHGLKDHDDVDVVFGLQKRRKGGRVERISGSLFYKIFNLFSDVKIPENHITARLMKRSYVLSLIQYRERSLFIGGVYELAGSRQMPMVVTKLSQSPTTYSPFRKLNLLVNAITSFSTFPLWLIFWLGFSISLFSFSMILYVIAKWYFVSIQPGWTSLIASIWAVGGLIMLSLGVIGIYTKKIIEEANNRPFTTIRNIYRNGRG
jgi:putative glycosyltransferase